MSRRRCLSVAGGAIAGAIFASGTASAQTGTDTSTETDVDPLGGGAGYSATVPKSAATTVVDAAADLEEAIGNASSGDVVYVAGDAELDVTDVSVTVPDGVTVASDRGVDGSSGAYLYTEEDTKGGHFVMEGESRFTGIEFRGAHPADDVGGTWYGEGIEVSGPAEIDNCELRGHGVAAVEIPASDGGSCHVHHNCITNNNQHGRGYGVSVTHDGGQPVIEWNYFNYNRHSVASDGEAKGYVCQYNHFGPKEVLHNIDTHDPAGVEYVVRNNVVETVEREYDDNVNHIVRIRGVPEESYRITDNWFFNPNAPKQDGDPAAKGQAIEQDDVSEWTNVAFENNYYGEEADCSFLDVIPGYRGSRSESE